MSPLQNMTQELLGAVPGTNFGLVRTKINEALAAIQNEQVWSFEIQTGGWLTPGLWGGNANGSYLSPGTIGVLPYSTTIVGDATATTSWLTPVQYPPLITQQQIRTPYYSLYSIIALGSAPTVAYLTINTPGSGQTTGAYVVNGTGGSGSGAQALITVSANGEVTIPPVVTNPGSAYATGGVGSPPTFTLAAGGTPATFTAVLNAQLTIDRPWMEPPQTLGSGTYMIYSAYYPQLPGFKRWFNARDTTNNVPMNWWKKTQADLANDDPERTIFDQPYYIVPYQMDTRPGSATYGQMLFELWPHPIQQLPYTFTVECNWPPLQYPTDIVPYPLTEELVKLRAYEMLYLWKETQRGDNLERGSGANWQFAMGAARAEYNDRLKRIRIMDRHLVDLYFTKVRQEPAFGGEPFSSPDGRTNIGWF